MVEQPALQEGFNGADGPSVVLVFPSLDEGNESGGVQVILVWLSEAVVSVVPAHHSSVGLEPGLLQEACRRGSALRLNLKKQPHKVSGRWTHTLEVVLGETEVQTTDVQTSLLQTLVQERRRAAQDHVGQHACESSRMSV